METPERKETRLKGYDYSKAGAYFVTVCIQGKKPCLSEITPVGGGVPDAPAVILSEYGKIVDKQIAEINEKFSGGHIDKHVIMPDHVHFIIVINGASGTPPPTRANQTLPAIISAFKRMTNKTAGQQLWQRGYYEHVIRGDMDLNEIRRYMDNNPQKYLLRKQASE
jgi:putative transposase